MAIAKRKKRFYDVEIPLIEKETTLIGFDIEDIDKKFLKYDMTRLLRGKNVLMQFLVEVKDKKATARPYSLKILNTFLRRMMRKGTDYVEDSFSCECNDAQIRIKPFLITRKKVSRAVRKALRNKCNEELLKYVEDTTIEEIFDSIVKNSLQKELSLKLKKIYPLSLCEIRVLKIEKELEPKTKKKVSKKEEEVKKAKEDSTEKSAEKIVEEIKE